MRKRNIVLVLCLLVISVLIMCFGISRRGGSVAASTGTVSEEEEKTDTPAYSERVMDLARKYIDEHPAQSYLLVMTDTVSYSPIPLSGENSISVTQPDGSENVIHIGENSFYVEFSNCDNQLCVKEGEVTLENKDSRVLLNMVYCLPHNLSLELLTPEETEELLRIMYARHEAYEAYMESQNVGDDMGAEG